MTHHLTAETSREAYRHLDASSLHNLILSLLREGGEWCIADIAEELRIQKSTLSPRLGELKSMGAIEYAGKKASHATGITAQHWRIKLQESLFTNN